MNKTLRKLLATGIVMGGIFVASQTFVANAGPITPISGGGTQTSTVPFKGGVVVGNGTTYAIQPTSTNGRALVQSSTAPFGVDWVTISSGGSGGVATSGSPLAQQVAFFFDPNTIQGSTGFTYNSSTKVLTVGTSTLTGVTATNLVFTNASGTQQSLSGYLLVAGATTLTNSLTQSGGLVALASTSITGTASVSGVFSGNGITNSGNATTTNLTITGVTNSLLLGTSTGAVVNFGGSTCAGFVTTISASGTVSCIATSTIVSGYSTSTGANPTQNIGLSVINGTANTFMRSDAAPALSVAIIPVWTGFHQFSVAGASTTQLWASSSTFSGQTIITNASTTNLSASGYILSQTIRDANGNLYVTSTPSGANPTANIGLAAVNGSATTFLRSDGAPALSQGIAPTWTAAHIFNGGATFNSTSTHNSSTVLVGLTSVGTSTLGWTFYIATTTSIFTVSSTGQIVINSNNLTDNGGTKYVTSTNSGTVSTSSALSAGQWVIGGAYNQIYSTSSQPGITFNASGTFAQISGPSSTGTVIIGVAANLSTSTGANPTASVGLSATNGTANTFMRSDAAPAIDQTILPKWTGLHQFSGAGASSTQLWSSSSTLNGSTTLPALLNVILATNGTGAIVATTTVTVSGANPSANVGLAAVNGSATTYLRSDGAPALSQAIIPTWSALHTFTGGATFNSTSTNNSSTLLIGLTSVGTSTVFWPFYIATTTPIFTVSSTGQIFINSNNLTDNGGTKYVTSTPSAANPTASVGTSAVNGTATTFMRSDAAPPISQSIAPTWSALHTFTGGATFNSTSTHNSSTAMVGLTSVGTSTIGWPLYVATTTPIITVSSTGQVIVNTNNLTDAGGTKYVTSTVNGGTVSTSTPTAANGVMYATTAQGSPLNSSSSFTYDGTNGVQIFNQASTTALRSASSTLNGFTRITATSTLAGNTSISTTTVGWPLYVATTTSIITVSSTGQVSINTNNLVDNGGNKYVTSTSAGTPTSTFTFMLTPGGSVLPNANFPSLVKTSSTNWVEATLDYNSTTTQSAYWGIGLPPNITTVGSSSLTIYWRADSGGTASSTVFTLDARCPTSTQTFDATSTPNIWHVSSTPVTVNGTGQVRVTSMPLTNSNFSANAYCQFKLNMDTGTSTIRNDVRYMRSIFTLLYQ